MSANDPTAKYYDLVHSAYKNSQVTDAECSLIQTIVDPGMKILDIGSGTGRHAKLLASMGYKITCIDSSIEMLNKIPKNINRFCTDFFEWESNEKFDLIILMWNAFNEIVLSEDQLAGFWSVCKHALNSRGVILINTIINEENFPPVTSYTNNIDSKLKFSWEIIKTDETAKTTLSKETLMDDKNNIVYQTHITQRWWSLEQIIKSSSKYDFVLKQLKLKENFEDYLLLTQK